MATSHRSPYCPKIVKIVRYTPKCPETKVCIHVWKCLSPPNTESTSEKDPISLCPLPSHDHAHWHHSIFSRLLLCVFIECLPLLWKMGSMRGDLTGLLHGSIPSPETVSGTQKVFKKCWLNK